MDVKNEDSLDAGLLSKQLTYPETLTSSKAIQQHLKLFRRTQKPP